MIAPELLKMLACPACAERSPLRQVKDYLVCTKEGIGFPILNGIPQLLPECAISADLMQEKIR